MFCLYVKNGCLLNILPLHFSFEKSITQSSLTFAHCLHIHRQFGLVNRSGKWSTKKTCHQLFHVQWKADFVKLKRNVHIPFIYSVTLKFKRTYLEFLILVVVSKVRSFKLHCNAVNKQRFVVGSNVNRDGNLDQRSLETRIYLLYSIYPDWKHCFGIEKKWINRFKMVYFWLGRYCTNQLISLSEFPVIYALTYKSLFRHNIYWNHWPCIAIIVRLLWVFWYWISIGKNDPDLMTNVNTVKPELTTTTVKSRF
jgi:hypothetical protein